MISEEYLASSPVSLVNFRVSARLINNFDKMCSVNDQNRSSVLRHLMHRYIEDELERWNNYFIENPLFPEDPNDKNTIGEGEPNQNTIEEYNGYFKDPISETWSPVSK